FFFGRPRARLLLLTLGRARCHPARARTGAGTGRCAGTALRSGTRGSLTGARRPSSTWFRHRTPRIRAGLIEPGEHSVTTGLRPAKHLRAAGRVFAVIPDDVADAYRRAGYWRDETLV